LVSLASRHNPAKPNPAAAEPYQRRPANDRTTSRPSVRHLIHLPSRRHGSGGASARYLAGLATMTRWARQLLRSLAATDNIHHSDNHGCTSLSGRSLRRIDHAPGGIFDPLFTGISANAAGINAAICRYPHLRRSL
jgi:hypothetical protein